MVDRTREVVPGMVSESFEAGRHKAAGLCRRHHRAFHAWQAATLHTLALTTPQIRLPGSLTLPSPTCPPPLQVICGMEVAELDGCPRMGPTFGAQSCWGTPLAASVVCPWQKHPNNACVVTHSPCCALCMPRPPPSCLALCSGSALHSPLLALLQARCTCLA